MDTPTFQLTRSDERLHIKGEITPRMKNEVLARLATFNKADRVTVEIDSDGGDADSGMEIFRAFRASSVTTIGIVTVEARSAASIILQGCTERIMLPKSGLQVHFISKRISARIAYDDTLLAACLQSFRKDQEELIALYMSTTHQSRAKILSHMIRGNERHVMNPKEALDSGFIDAISPHPF